MDVDPFYRKVRNTGENLSKAGKDREEMFPGKKGGVAGYMGLKTVKVGRGGVLIGEKIADLKERVAELTGKNWAVVGAYIIGAVGVAALIGAAIVHH